MLKHLLMVGAVAPSTSIGGCVGVGAASADPVCGGPGTPPYAPPLSPEQQCAWCDVFTRSADHTETQARALTAAGIDWQAQQRVVVHHTEPLSVAEAILQGPGHQSVLTGDFVSSEPVKGRNRKGQVLAFLTGPRVSA